MTPESAINRGYRTEALPNLEISATKSGYINVVTNAESCGSGLGVLIQLCNGGENGDEDDSIKGQDDNAEEKAKLDRLSPVTGTEKACSGGHQTLDVDVHCAEKSKVAEELLHRQSDVNLSRSTAMSVKTQHTSRNTVDDVAFSSPDNAPDIKISITRDGSETEDIELQELDNKSKTTGI